jgi:hypothetical protein
LLTLEFGDPIEPTRCADCGGTSRTFTRFVYQDGDPYAIYFARFSDNHPRREVALAVGLGQFGEGSDASQRVSFGLIMRMVNSQFEVMVVEPEQSPWPNQRVLGPMLSRTEALSHPRIKDVFHITDHVTMDDPDVKRYFETNIGNA